MAKQFPSLSFGPMHLRPVLRRRVERREHLIAWGQATTTGDQQGFQIAMGLIPAIGPAFAAMAAASNKRFVIVTSRRLIVVLNRKPGALRRGKAVCFEAQHEYLEIERASRKSPKFTLSAMELDLKMPITVSNHKKKAGRRLVEALSALTIDPDPGDAPAFTRP